LDSKDARFRLYLEEKELQYQLLWRELSRADEEHWFHVMIFFGIVSDTKDISESNDEK